MMPTHDHDRHQAATRHTNASATFTLFAALFFLGGAVSFGAAVEKKASMTTQALAATPLVVGSFSAGIAYVSRQRAAALRRADEADARQGEDAADEHRPPAA